MSATSVGTGRRAGSGAGPRAARGARQTSAWLAPTPPSVAIEIASRRVTVVELAHGSGGAVIAAHASETLPPDAVTPAMVGPNIPDPRPVVDALRRAF